ncbi:hypothetical protein [Pseudomonas sp. HLS-6 TE3448]
MHPLLVKTFGGLSTQYYLRNFLFGLIFPAILFAAISNTPKGITFGLVLLCVINSLLYPYARFVYESVIGYIFGNNVFFVNALLMLMLKLMTMLMCWNLALFIAPLGLAYLYFYHSRAARQ